MINSEFSLATNKNVVYSVTRLRKNTYILIEGKNLKIDHYTEEDMLIKGRIFSIQYPS